MHSLIIEAVYMRCVDLCRHCMPLKSSNPQIVTMPNGAFKNLNMLKGV